MTTTTPDIRRFQDNLRDELDGVALYEALSKAESDPKRADLFRQLAQAEAEHAAVWRDKLRALGIDARKYRPSMRTRLLVKLAQRYGPRFVLPSLAAAEFAGGDKYASQPDAASFAADERGHAAVLHGMAHGDVPAHGGLSGGEVARAERWHRGGTGNDLRAAVLGANDGLVSNFCLMMGIAGAGTANNVLLLTGIAGLVAGACSMALGEWLSVMNARELARTQLAKEAEEIEHTPDAERRELSLIFQAKGLDKAEAERVAAQIMADPRTALDTLAREELGIDPAHLGGDPWRAAITSFALFAFGAAVPVAPFFFARGGAAIASAIILSACALGTIGVATSMFNGRTAVFSATRQIVIGCAAAAVTYGVGALLGVSLT